MRYYNLIFFLLLNLVNTWSWAQDIPPKTEGLPPEPQYLDKLPPPEELPSKLANTTRLSQLEVSQIRISILDREKFLSIVNKDTFVAVGTVGKSDEIVPLARQTRLFCQVIPTPIFSTLLTAEVRAIKQEESTVDINENVKVRMHRLHLSVGHQAAAILECTRGEVELFELQHLQSASGHTRRSGLSAYRFLDKPIEPKL